MDAFTSKECICFNVKVLDDHVPVALEILCDLVLYPNFNEQDIARERGVILEEIKMDEDNPDYLVHEIFTQNFWKDHPLGKPILGTKETVKRFEREAVLNTYSHRFAPGNIIVAAAGHLDHDRFVDLVVKHFEHLKPAQNGFHSAEPKIVPRIVLRNKKALEQVQLCIGVPAYPIAHEKRHAGYILNTLLGGGMSSRLFLEVRERRGLAYSVGAGAAAMSDHGTLSIHAGVAPDKAVAALEVIAHELRRLAAEPVDEDELERVRGSYEGSLLLALEDSYSVATRNARSVLQRGYARTPEESLALVEAVTAGDIQRLAAELLRPDLLRVARVGHFDDKVPLVEAITPALTDAGSEAHAAR